MQKLKLKAQSKMPWLVGATTKCKCKNLKVYRRLYSKYTKGFRWQFEIHLHTALAWDETTVSIIIDSLYFSNRKFINSLCFLPNAVHLSLIRKHFFLIKIYSDKPTFTISGNSNICLKFNFTFFCVSFFFSVIN